jgi:hypothetical protein
MVRKDKFFDRLVGLRDEYWKLEEENVRLASDAVELDGKLRARDALIGDLCRALERAQEIIVVLGETSGDEALLKEAKVYANAIGGVVTEQGPKPFTHYADNPVIKKHRTKTPTKGRTKAAPKPKAKSKRGKK